MRILFAFVLLVYSVLAQAYIQNARLDPPNPTSDDEVFFLVDTGICHFMLDDRGWYVLRDGDSVHMEAQFVDSRGSPAFCNYAPLTQVYSLGRLPAGNYHFSHYSTDIDAAVIFDPLVFEYAVDFTVSQGTVYKIPVFQPWGFGLLMIGILLLAGNLFDSISLSRLNSRQ